MFSLPNPIVLFFLSNLEESESVCAVFEARSGRRDCRQVLCHLRSRAREGWRGSAQPPGLQREALPQPSPPEQPLCSAAGERIPVSTLGRRVPSPGLPRARRLPRRGLPPGAGLLPREKSRWIINWSENVLNPAKLQSSDQILHVLSRAAPEAESSPVLLCLRRSLSGARASGLRPRRLDLVRRPRAHAGDAAGAPGRTPGRREGRTERGKPVKARAARERAELARAPAPAPGSPPPSEAAGGLGLARALRAAAQPCARCPVTWRSLRQAAPLLPEFLVSGAAAVSRPGLGLTGAGLDPVLLLLLTGLGGGNLPGTCILHQKLLGPAASVTWDSLSGPTLYLLSQHLSLHAPG